MDEEITLFVKWHNKEYELPHLNGTMTISTLRGIIYEATGVRPERQKLLNLKCKGTMVAADDTCKLSDLNLKPGFKIMMVGSLEKDIGAAISKPDEIPNVIDDLDEKPEDTAIEHQQVYLDKIQRRIKEYQINVINPPRDGKKLLVLDIDYTLFDHRSVAETGTELMRPFLHEFLTTSYEDYDIVIWSATGMKWIEEKMKILGVSSHPDYRIAFFVDGNAMITVHTEKYGVTQVKPLGVIWGKFPCYNSSNTIMFDDVRRNFLMNPKNGLRIKPFQNAHQNRATDCELLKLTKYLKAIANSEDLSSLDHRHWERVLKEHERAKKRKRGDPGSSPPVSGTPK